MAYEQCEYHEILHPALTGCPACHLADYEAAELALSKMAAKVNSLTYYECQECGYRGPCYGSPTPGPARRNEAVAMPWCPRCGNHESLTEIDRGRITTPARMLVDYPSLGDYLYGPDRLPFNCEIDGKPVGGVCYVCIEMDANNRPCLMIMTDPTLSAHLSASRVIRDAEDAGHNPYCHVGKKYLYVAGG